MMGSSVLNESWIIDTFVSLGQIISFSEQSSFKLRCEIVIRIVLCYSHQACCNCLLYYLCEITNNNGIHIYFSECNYGFGFEEKYWRIDEFWCTKGTDRRICIPLLTRLIKEVVYR